MHAIIVLEQWYCKIKAGLVSSSLYQVDNGSFRWADKPCGVSYQGLVGVGPDDKAMRPTTTPDVLHSISIIKEWVKNHSNVILS